MSRGYFYILNQEFFYNFTFQTDFEVLNVGGDGTFSPTFTTINGELPTWTLIGGTEYTEQVGIVQSNRTTTETLVASELDGTTQDVVVTFSTNDPANITGINLSSENIVGELDLSLFTGVSNIQLELIDITSLILPQLTVNINVLYLFQNTLTSLDLTPLGAFFGGDIQCPQIATLTSVTFPTTSRTFTRLYFASCSLVTVDLSGLLNLSGDLLFTTNGTKSITTLTLPPTSGTVTRMDFYQHSLTSLDLSNITVDGRLEFGEGALTSVIFKNNVDFGIGESVVQGLSLFKNQISTITFANITTDNAGCFIDLDNNNMSEALVDALLAEFVVLSNGGLWYNCRLKIGGGGGGGYTGNTAPSASGTADAVTLGDREWTVTTN